MYQRTSLPNSMSWAGANQQLVQNQNFLGNADIPAYLQYTKEVTTVNLQPGYNNLLNLQGIRPVPAPASTNVVQQMNILVLQPEVQNGEQYAAVTQQQNIRQYPGVAQPSLTYQQPASNMLNMRDVFQKTNVNPGPSRQTSMMEAASPQPSTFTMVNRPSPPYSSIVNNSNNNYFNNNNNIPPVNALNNMCSANQNKTVVDNVNINKNMLVPPVPDLKIRVRSVENLNNLKMPQITGNNDSSINNQIMGGIPQITGNEDFYDIFNADNDVNNVGLSSFERCMEMYLPNEKTNHVQQRQQTNVRGNQQQVINNTVQNNLSGSRIQNEPQNIPRRSAGNNVLPPNVSAPSAQGQRRNVNINFNKNSTSTGPPHPPFQRSNIQSTNTHSNVLPPNTQVPRSNMQNIGKNSPLLGVAPPNSTYQRQNVQSIPSGLPPNPDVQRNSSNNNVQSYSKPAILRKGNNKPPPAPSHPPAVKNTSNLPTPPSNNGNSSSPSTLTVNRNVTPESTAQANNNPVTTATHRLPMTVPKPSIVKSSFDLNQSRLSLQASVLSKNQMLPPNTSKILIDQVIKDALKVPTSSSAAVASNIATSPSPAANNASTSASVSKTLTSSSVPISKALTSPSAAMSKASTSSSAPVSKASTSPSSSAPARVSKASASSSAPISKALTSPSAAASRASTSSSSSYATSKPSTSSSSSSHLNDVFRINEKANDNLTLIQLPAEKSKSFEIGNKEKNVIPADTNDKHEESLTVNSILQDFLNGSGSKEVPKDTDNQKTDEVPAERKEEKEADISLDEFLIKEITVNSKKLRNMDRTPKKEPVSPNVTPAVPPYQSPPISIESSLNMDVFENDIEIILHEPGDSKADREKKKNLKDLPNECDLNLSIKKKPGPKSKTMPAYLEEKGRLSEIEESSANKNGGKPEHKNDEVPVEKKSSKKTEDKKLTKQAEEKITTQKPERNKSTKKPKDKKIIAQPEEKKSTKKQEEKKVLAEPEEKNVAKKTEEKKVFAEPKERKVLAEPQGKNVTKKAEEKTIISKPKQKTSTEKPETPIKTTELNWLDKLANASSHLVADDEVSPKTSSNEKKSSESPKSKKKRSPETDCELPSKKSKLAEQVETTKTDDLSRNTAETIVADKVNDDKPKEVNLEKLELLMKLYADDPAPSVNSNLKRRSSSEEESSRRRKLSKTEIVKNKNIEREKISIVSKEFTQKSAAAKQDEKKTVEVKTAPKISPKSSKESRKSNKKSPKITEADSSIVDEHEETKESNDNNKNSQSSSIDEDIKPDFAELNPNIDAASLSPTQITSTSEEFNFDSTMRALQSVAYHRCMSCDKTVETKEFWINVKSIELKCTGCLAKLSSENDCKHEDEIQKLKLEIQALKKRNKKLEKIKNSSDSEVERLMKKTKKIQKRLLKDSSEEDDY